MNISRAALLSLLAGLAAHAELPGGFKSLFNGKELRGWHISQTNHHGKTPEWRVTDGVLVGSQMPEGSGGILLTDQKYRDFELSLEVKPDFGCDGGIFLRSNEAGEAYQVMLDYLEGGSIGGIYGEGLKGVEGPPAKGWQQHWRKDDWNALRIRMEGVAPHITVWLNGHKITDWTDPANHAAGGLAEGMIAVQVHGGDLWVKGGMHRFRYVGIKRL